MFYHFNLTSWMPLQKTNCTPNGLLRINNDEQDSAAVTAAVFPGALLSLLQ